MKKKILTIAAAFMTASVVALSGCGGGGGGGSTSSTPSVPGTGNPTPAKTVTVPVHFSAPAARVAGRSAAANLANASVIAYAAGDASKKVLNSAANTTDANGDVTVDIKMDGITTIDVVIEAISNSGNVLVALDNLTTSQTTKAQADDATTRKAKIFHYAHTPTLALDTTVSVIDNIFTAKGVDVLDYIEDADNFTNSAVNTKAFVEDMEEALKDCDVGSATLTEEKENCIADELKTISSSSSEAEKAMTALEMEYRTDNGTSTDADVMYSLVGAGDRTAFDAAAAIFADAKVNINEKFETKSQVEEFIPLMAKPIAVWNDGAKTLAQKRVIIRDMAVATYFTETFTNSRVQYLFNALGRGIDGEGYYYVLSKEAVKNATAPTLTDENIQNAMKAYDVIRGMLMTVMIKDVGASKTVAYDSIDAFVNVLAALGSGSENSGAMIDNWVVEWEKASVKADLMTFLAPLGMDDPSKTDNLMKLAQAISNLPAGATDAEAAAVMVQYVSAATAAKALEIYHKGQTQTCAQGDYFTFPPVNINLSPSPSCVSDEDIFVLFETHYGKSLPKLRAFVAGIEKWLEDSKNNTTLLGLGLSVSEYLPKIVDLVKDPATKAQAGAALDIAGVKKELFYLYVNMTK